MELLEIPLLKIQMSILIESPKFNETDLCNMEWFLVVRITMSIQNGVTDN